MCYHDNNNNKKITITITVKAPYACHEFYIKVTDNFEDNFLLIYM